ncbi:DUF3616 domain-containing protein [Roseibium sp. MMSF_3412]|uniref:DUF3616 domain-containing protein n=1 Tax=Roseibium sp. MMSF_3412 TaxID=3046712 RepID=UPI0027402489|nr:DUF3616 domain-containing protein [Roseibium sp. MMSF_3412]
MHLFPVLLLTTLLVTPALAEIERSKTKWKVKPDFEKSAAARESISGADCAPGGWCLAANDEKNYAQFFKIRKNRLDPDKKGVIRLLPKKIDGKKMDEIDAEGVVFVPSRDSNAPSFFYVTGSHGLSRSGDFQPSRFTLFRFPVETKSGKPTFKFSDKKVAPEVERTMLLAETIKSNPDLAPFADQTLDRNGVTIEGISEMDGDMLFGLRSPCLAGHALILRVPAEDLFQDTPPPSTTDRVALGDNVGIRDLTRVKDGLLILAGRSDDRRGSEDFTCGEKRKPPAPAPSLWFWSGLSGDAARPLGPLPGVDRNASVETLLVLEETDAAFKVLVLFDGEKNGAPVEFLVGK